MCKRCCAQAFAKEGDELMKECVFWALMFVALGVVDGIEYFLGVSRIQRANKQGKALQEVFFGIAGENLTMRMRMGVFRNIMRQVSRVA